MTAEELAEREAGRGIVKGHPRVDSGYWRDVNRGIQSSRGSGVPPLFKVGHRVRTRMMNPTGHTGCRGMREERLGSSSMTMAYTSSRIRTRKYEGENRQHVYSVRFTAREFWGEQASPPIPYILTCGMATLSEPNEAVIRRRFPHSKRFLATKRGPVFAEPWQAQAFAMAIKLSEQGHFTWKEWAAELAAELKRAEDRGEPDDGTHYYEHWLAAPRATRYRKAVEQPVGITPEEGRLGRRLSSHASRQARRTAEAHILTSISLRGGADTCGQHDDSS